MIDFSFKMIIRHLRYRKKSFPIRRRMRIQNQIQMRIHRWIQKRMRMIPSLQLRLHHQMSCCFRHRKSCWIHRLHWRLRRLRFRRRFLIRNRILRWSERCSLRSFRIPGYQHNLELCPYRLGWLRHKLFPYRKGIIWRITWLRLPKLLFWLRIWRWRRTIIIKLISRLPIIRLLVLCSHRLLGSWRPIRLIIKRFTRLRLRFFWLIFFVRRIIFAYMRRRLHWHRILIIPKSIVCCSRRRWCRPKLSIIVP